MIKILLVLCFSSLVSCQITSQKDSNSNGKQTSTPILEKVDSNHEVEDGYLSTCKDLNIDYLKTSLKSNQIRIWIEFSLCDSGRIINLKNENSNWRGEFYQYRFNLKEDFNSNKRVLISQNKTDGVPLSGWSDFLSQIEKVGIYSLNDNERKHNMGLCSDGGELVVEIVKDNKYSRFVYPCWKAIEDQSQINKVKKILKLVQDEFGFKVFPLDLQFSDLKKILK